MHLDGLTKKFTAVSNNIEEMVNKRSAQLYRALWEQIKNINQQSLIIFAMYFYQSMLGVNTIKIRIEQ